MAVQIVACRRTTRSAGAELVLHEFLRTARQAAQAGDARRICSAEFEVCIAELGVCTSGFEVCTAELRVCTAELEVCTTELQVCTAELEICRRIGRALILHEVLSAARQAAQVRESGRTCTAELEVGAAELGACGRIGQAEIII